MDLSFLDSFRPYISRVVGAAIGGLAGYATNHIGITVDPGAQASVTGAVVLGVYGLAHKFLDKKVNPADSASAHLAVQGQADAASLKAQ